MKTYKTFAFVSVASTAIAALAFIIAFMGPQVTAGSATEPIDFTQTTLVRVDPYEDYTLPSTVGRDGEVWIIMGNSSYVYVAEGDGIASGYRESINEVLMVVANESTRMWTILFNR